jgi:hypothetical protein
MSARIFEIVDSSGNEMHAEPGDEVMKIATVSADLRGFGVIHLTPEQAEALVKFIDNWFNDPRRARRRPK